ncbi:T9SS type A sorting domain-containing protein [Litoribaculum gwangyangense]|uniref:T9SS type A sorting domain-containing protein n=1 Tax=Litoribaculum gwangyangense TaxID=1130722 RepID=A0ABP9C5Z7_9FLAO
MKKYYLLFLFITLAFFQTQQGISQSKVNNIPAEKIIENLSIYPNPASSGKIYITSKNNLNKKVEFYNVLGKQIFSIDLVGKELNISNLSKGVYILKITEGEISETRKLIIK